MDKILAVVVIALGVFAAALFLGFLLAFPVMWLWNYGFAGGLGLPRIDVYHAWAISVLCSWLFKSSSGSTSSKK